MQGLAGWEGSVTAISAPLRSVQGRICNGTRCILGALVWTRDIQRAIQLARSILSGQVYVNQYGSAGVIGAPFGGYKNSGFGRTGSADTILECTQINAVMFNAGQ